MKRILEALKNGDITLEEAEKQLRVLTITEIENLARLDLHRDTRKGIPEIIFGEGKTPESLIKILQYSAPKKPYLIISRVDPSTYNLIVSSLSPTYRVELSQASQTVIVAQQGYHPTQTKGKVGILTGGTSDMTVADEARIVAESMGCKVLMATDVGVAAIHRLFPPLKEMIKERIDSLIVVAGMEGALASVVTGLVDVPVIGVPTSTGYGFGGKGQGALTSMLQSCALGLAVVNIDNGIAAGALAALIANRAAHSEPQ